ncbi:MAG: hypothetical protein ACMVO3_00120 [Thalassobaculum sp.]
MWSWARSIRPGFAGGSIALDIEASERAVAADVGAPMKLDGRLAAFALAEIVDENMANAARVHAIEWGKDISARADDRLRRRGAAARSPSWPRSSASTPSSCRPAPASARPSASCAAPASYEVVRSRYLLLAEFDAASVDRLLLRHGRRGPGRSSAPAAAGVRPDGDPGGLTCATLVRVTRSPYPCRQAN